MPLKCNWIETYKNKNGKYIFVYIVSGSDSEKEDFKIKQGVYYRETPDGRPLFQTPFYGGKLARLIPTRDMKKYILDNSEIAKIESLTNQYGGNANIEFAEKLNDINWLLDLENKLLAHPDKMKLSEEQQKRKNELNKKLKIVNNESLPELLINPVKNYFESKDIKTGFTFLNEWHFASFVLQNLVPGSHLEFKIIHLADPMLDPFFSGILEDSNGKQYNIEEPENIWMFQELIKITNILIHASIREKKITFSLMA